MQVFFKSLTILLLFCFSKVFLLASDYDDALNSYNTGKYDDAEAQLKKIKPATPEMVLKAILLKSRLLLVRGEYSKLQKGLDALLKKYPESTELKLIQVKAFMAVGYYKKARQLLIGMIRKNPKFWEAHILLVELAEILNDRYLMKREERLFFRLYGNNRLRGVEGLVAAARAVQNADPTGAWRVYGEAEKLNNKFLQTYVLAGRLAFERYNWGKAARNFEKALKINPNHVEALTSYAVLSVTQHAIHQANTMLDKALAINPRYVEALTFKASAYLISKQYEDGFKEIQKALAVNPNYPEALAVLATYYDSKKMLKKRDEAIKKALAVGPKSPLVYLVLSKFAKLRYDFKASEHWAREAIKTAPDDWEGYYLAGMNLLRQGEENEGYKLLSKSFNMNNYNLWAYNMLLVLDKEFQGGDFVCYETPHFVVKMTKKDGAAHWAKIEPFLESMYQKYTKKYGIIPKGSKQYNRKILILILPDHNYFSARTLGIPGTGAAGICFGQVLALPAPQEGNEVMEGLTWQELIIHEFLHVLTLQKTSYLIPRWFTEGISTYEENHAFDEKVLSLFVKSADQKLLLDVDKMELGFTQPTYPGQVLVSYMHAQLVCEYLIAKYGEGIFTKMMDLFKEGKKTPEVLEIVTNKKISVLNSEIREYTKKLVKRIKSKLKQQDKNGD
jgi:tetratricopeptide (TPR) repeat protein